MSDSETPGPPVAIVLGPGANPDVIAQTEHVLEHFGIAFTRLDWQDLASHALQDFQLFIFETGLAYTDEHLGLPADIVAPVLRVVTDELPRPTKS